MSAVAYTIKKPVRLEMNNAGAWKVVLTFDADDKDTECEVRDTVHRMGSLSARLGGRQAWRLYAPVIRMALSYWTVEHGWKDAA